LKLLPDTNVLVYETVEDSEHHEEAVGIIDSAREVYITPIVLHEYIWVMLRLIGASPGFVAQKLQEYFEDPRTRYLLEPRVVLINALHMLREDGENMKEVNDYIILATALYHGLVLATYDKKLRKRAAKRGVDVIP
jgi:predicted nucleic acid-binding protein